MTRSNAARMHHTDTYGREIETVTLANDAHDIVLRNLTLWLGKRKMRRAELARRLGITQASINHWYDGKASPSLTTVGEMAVILEIPLKELFHDAGAEVTPIKRPEVDEVDEALATLANATGRKIKIEKKPGSPPKK